jgi:hypothetical protein
MKAVPDRMLNLRWLKRPAIDEYRVRWDGDTRQWVLHWSTHGDLVGAQYRQRGSVFTLPRG